jgi:Protein of unknown function (DUF3489)
MTNENSAAANIASATDSADPVNVSKPTRKRLRASSEAHEKAATSSPSPLPTTRKKAGHTASAKLPAVSDATDAVPAPMRPTKASLVEALLTREGGASLETLCVATGWQSHTCRAFLTGLRKKGREVIRARDKDSKSIYLIAPDRSTTPSLAAEQAGLETA